MSDDFSRTLDDVIAGYQGMHATMASFSGPSAMGGVPAMTTPGAAPIPTPPPPTPLLTTPGMAMGAYAPPPPTPSFPPPPPMPPAAFIPYTSAPPAPAQMHDPAGVMAQMYQQGMGHARSTYVQNPTLAAAMDPTMTYPSAGMMTNPSMGVFRQSPVSDPMVAAPYSVSGQSPPSPLLPIPSMYRTRPGYEFARPFEAASYSGTELERLRTQGFAGFAEGAGSAFAGAAGGVVMGGIGAAVGGYFGGVAGAEKGMMWGSLAGSLLAYHPAARAVASTVMRPAIEQRADEIQLQSASRRFVMGGGGLDLTGAGLGEREAGRLGRAFTRIARESDGEVTRQDIVQMTQLAGEQGLLNAAQDADEIAKVMKSMMSLVGTMAKVTGDPDFRNNIQRIAQLKQLGVGMGDMDIATQNLAHYARMAGVSVDQVMARDGLQGATVYQGAGLNAGQGMMVGAASAGQARALEASGALSSQQIALLGGQQGVSQRLTEMSAAMMSGPNKGLLGALVRRGENGQLEIDEATLGRLQRGELSYKDALRQGSDAFSQDRQLLLDTVAQKDDLLMSMGDKLGPAGQQQLLMSVLGQIGEDTGMDLRQAAITMSGGDTKMGMVIDAMRDPRYQRMVMQQQQVEMRQRQFEALQADRARRDAEPGLIGRGLRGAAMSIGMTTEELRRFTPGGLFDTFQEGGARWLREREERARVTATGGRWLGARSTIDVGETGTMSFEEAREWRRRAAEEFGEGDQSAIGSFYDDATRVGGAFLVTSATLRAAREAAGQQGVFGRAAGKFSDTLMAPASFEANHNRLINAQKEMVGVNFDAVRLSGDRQMAAVDEAMKTVGGEKFIDMRSHLAKTIKKRVGLRVGRESLVSEAEINEAARFAGVDPASLSREEKAALISDALSETSEGRHARDEIKDTMADVTMEAMEKELGLEVGTGVEGLLEDFGMGGTISGYGFKLFGSRKEDASDAEREALNALAGDPDDVAYLLLVALQSTGSAGTAKLEKAMFRANGDKHREKLRNARLVFRSLSKEARETLASRAPRIAGEKVMSALASKDKKGDKAYENLKRRTEAAGGLLRADQRLDNTKDLRAALVGRNVHGVSSHAELVARIKGAKGGDLARLEEALGGDVVDRALSLDAGDPDAMARFEQLVTTRVNAGATSVGEAELRGVESSATKDLSRQMAAQTGMMMDFMEVQTRNTEATNRLANAMEAELKVRTGTGAVAAGESEVEKPGE